MFSEIIELPRIIHLQERLLVVGKKTLVFVIVRSRQIPHLLNAREYCPFCSSGAHLFYVVLLIFIFPYSVLKG